MLLLKQHADWILFALVAFLFVVFPQLDLWVSGWFYDPDSHSWPMNDNAVVMSIYELLRYGPFFIVPLLLAAVAMTFVKHGIDKAQRRIWVFLLVGLLAGPGLLVHSVFKEVFERPRPRAVQEFGGTETFEPAFVVSEKCQRSCTSFVSGHSAMGFWLMAFAWVFRRRSWLWAGIIVGSLASAGRIVQGGHFLSDTLVSGFICYFVYRGFSWWLLGHSRIQEPATR